MHTRQESSIRRRSLLRLLLRWTGLCAVAELLGIASAAVWYGAMNVWVGEPKEIALRIGAWLMMSLAAVPEGFVLGGLQSVGLRWFFNGVSTARWVFTTICVGFLGWGIGTFIPLFIVDETAMTNGDEPGLAVTAFFAAIFGILVGLLFGGVQSSALPAEAIRKFPWVVGNAAGWALGLPLIYIGAQIAADQAGWAARIILWACGGVGAGATVGIFTGFALFWMTPRDSLVDK